MTELKPGRELDALVAEKVMGIPKAEIDDHCGFSPYKYSTSIEAAWQVVEKISPRLDDIWIQTEVGGWAVKLHENCEWFVGWSPDLPHAISLAALRVVGYTISK